MDTRCIVLLGHSLLLDGVAASLTGGPGLRLVHMNPNVTSSEHHIRSLKPNLVIFEWEPARAESLYLLLEKYPGIVLVGIHPEHSGLVVLGHHKPLATMQDLVAMLDDMLTRRTVDLVTQSCLFLTL